MKRRNSVLVMCLVVFLGVAGCKKDSSPTAAPAPPSLNANPSSVTLAAGASQAVAVSGGTPPYAILTAPNATATAVLSNPDSAIASVLISGVTVASVSTAVTIKDSSPSQIKEVSIPIRVQ